MNDQRHDDVEEDNKKTKPADNFHKMSIDDIDLNSVIDEDWGEEIVSPQEKEG